MATHDSIRFFAICRPVLILLTLVIPQLVQAQWQATVGAQSGDLAKQAMAFLPSEMWIHAGDSITWTFDSAEPHTVSFLKAGQVRPPDQVGCPGFSPDGFATFDGSTCVTTGRLKEGQTFTVTLPTANNFKLVCLIHRNMTATVHVLGLSEPLPHDQAFYDRQGQQERERLLSAIDLGSHDEQAAQNHVRAGAGVISATPGERERGCYAFRSGKGLHPCWRDSGVVQFRPDRFTHHHLRRRTRRSHAPLGQCNSR